MQKSKGVILVYFVCGKSNLKPKFESNLGGKLVSRWAINIAYNTKVTARLVGTDRAKSRPKVYAPVDLSGLLVAYTLDKESEVIFFI